MNYVLRIKKRQHEEWLTFLILLIPFLFGPLIDLMHMPSIIKYSIDVIWLLLLIFLWVNRFAMPNKSSYRLLQWVLVFFAVSLLGFAINLKTPLYYLWGFRNNFRFFVFFFSCIVFMDARNIDGYLKLFDVLFYVNFFITLIQFFGFGIQQDYLGGIFGSHKGTNAATIIFLSIVTTKDILLYLNHRKKLSSCLIKCCMALLVAALAEIKFFFVFFVIIAVLSVMFTDFTTKKIAILFLAVVGVMVGAAILQVIFPSWENWFSLESMLESAISNRGYSGKGGMNRLTGVPMAWDMFLTGLPEKIFGLGMGNCDTSAFRFLNTEFFQAYGHLHYNWFSLPFMLMETGLVGLTVYITFFVMVYYLARKQEKIASANASYCQLAKVMSILSLILIVYNSSLRNESGYMVYFILALPFINSSKQSQAAACVVYQSGED